MKKIVTIILIFGFSNALVFTQEIVQLDSIMGELYKDVPYKSGDSLSEYEKERCKLDIYIPKDSELEKLPVIVHFYGGGFVVGDKSEGWSPESNNFGFRFLEAGIVMVMPNYRLSGQNGAKWPDYLLDAATAVAWVEEHISEYGGDPDNIFVTGFSAGAYLTHMLSIDDQWFNEIGFDENKIRGYIPISGQTRSHPTIANDLNVDPKEIMAKYPHAMPLGNVKEVHKPICIFVGESEEQTKIDNQEYFDALIEKESTDVFLNKIPENDHMEMRNSLGDAECLTRKKMIEFISRYSEN